MEISSEAVTDYSGFNNFGGSNETTDFSGSANLGQALKRLKEQLSLNDDNFPDIGVLPSENDNANDSPILEYGTETAKQDQNGVSLNGPEYSVDDQYYDSYSGVLLGSNDLGLQKNEGLRCSRSLYRLFSFSFFFVFSFSIIMLKVFNP